MSWLDECPALVGCAAPTQTTGGKWATWPEWLEACMDCGEPVVMSSGRWEGMGPPMHMGCAGWPHCGCPESHPGDCQ